MPRRPIAKKAPAKPKRKAPAKAKRKATTYSPSYHLGFAHGVKRAMALEAKVVEQARHITNQERTIAGLLSLLNDKGP